MENNPKKTSWGGILGIIIIILILIIGAVYFFRDIEKNVKSSDINTSSSINATSTTASTTILMTATST